MQWVVLKSRPGDGATNPLDSSLLTQAHLALLFIDCRLLNLFATTNDSAKVGLYTNRGANISIVCSVKEYLRKPTILFGTGYIVRRVYIIFCLSVIFCYFLLPLISFYTSVSRVSFHLFIRCLLLSFCRCNVQGTLIGKIISQIICLCW
jgi:hypothetical protein